MICAASDRYQTGWRVGDKLIHPREAYTNAEGWLSHFEATFPDMAKRMHAYSDSKGWSEYNHRRAWVPAVVAWLNRTAAP